MTWQVLQGDVRERLAELPPCSVHLTVTSPPYFGLRSYGTPPQHWADGWYGELGGEATPDSYVAHLVEAFRAVGRVLRDDGCLLLNIGDSYAPDHAQRRLTLPEGRVNWGLQGQQVGSRARDNRGTPPGLKPKDLCMIPARLAMALQADGWYLRGDYIWHKPNPMPEGVKDRCTRSHEYLFHLAKQPRYYWDSKAMRERGEEGHNRRSVWTIPTEPFKAASVGLGDTEHYAIMPQALARPCILAGCPPEGTVLDPFCGIGTTLLVAKRLGRQAIGVDLHPDYARIAERRLALDAPLFATQARVNTY